MAYKLYLLANAAADYMEAIEWHKKRSAERAEVFIEKTAEALEVLKTFPLNYSYYNKPYRRIVLKAISYKMIYKVEEDKVLIYAIYHTSRNDADIRRRLP